MYDLQPIYDALPEIQSVIGLATGGQKVVFRAQHARFGDVVLKLLKNPLASERIKREIEVATNCHFANVPVLYEWGNIFQGQQDETVYLLEQYVEGETLRNRIHSKRWLSLGACLQLMRNLLETTVELEKQQLVHRDIKPENIVVDPQEKFWLLDFGIARHLSKESITATAALLGPATFGYAAPEQIRNLKPVIDSRADLFSIGVVAYEVLSGTQPFIDGARDVLEVIRRTENLPVPALTIPGDTEGQLSAFIAVLMDKYPSRRPRNAAMALEWFNDLVPTVNVAPI